MKIIVDKDIRIFVNGEELVIAGAGSTIVFEVINNKPEKDGDLHSYHIIEYKISPYFVYDEKSGIYTAHVDPGRPKINGNLEEVHVAADEFCDKSRFQREFLQSLEFIPTQHGFYIKTKYNPLDYGLNYIEIVLKLKTKENKNDINK